MSKRRDAQRYRKSYSYFRPAPLFESSGTIDQEYLDKSIKSSDWKQSVRAATTGPGDDFGLSSGPYLIDGISIVNENRVLLKNQINAAENGIYVYSSDTQSLTRALDAVQDVLSSDAICYVEEGITLASTVWFLSNSDPIVVDTTNQTWEQSITAPTHVLVWNEKLTGVTDGVNTVFTLLYQPVTSDKLMLFSNGVLQEQDGVNSDFQISSSTVTFAIPPEYGTKIIATYLK